MVRIGEEHNMVIGGKHLRLLLLFNCRYTHLNAYKEMIKYDIILLLLWWWLELATKGSLFFSLFSYQPAASNNGV